MAAIFSQGTPDQISTWIPACFGTPEKPALGAFQYEVQWGHKASPFVTTGELKTPTSSTSTVLPLGPGVWYYRVRGVNAFIPGAKPLMSWSDPTRLVVTRPSFRVVH